LDIDRLKKLTRLANNNPNDHEANLAARRVCKMLEEANFTLTSAPPPSMHGVAYDEASNMGDIFSEMLRQQAKQQADRLRREEEVHKKAQERVRKQQEEARAQAAKEQVKRQQQDPDEWFQDVMRSKWTNRRTGEVITELEYQSRNLGRKKPKSHWDFVAENMNWEPPNYNYWNGEQTRGRRQDRPSRTLVCKKCGKEQETKFMGTPETFLCWSCWRF